MRKTAILLGGGSGAGKSTALARLSLPAGLVRIDPDAFKAAIPAYRAAVAAGDPHAAARFHAESARMADDALEAAIARGDSFILDGTMKSTGKARALVARLEAAGYDVQVIFVMACVEEAIRRCISRGAEIGRIVPETVIREAHRGARMTMRTFRRIGIRHQVVYNM